MSESERIRKIGDLMRALLPENAQQAIQQWLPIVNSWEEVVGSGLACHSRPKELRKGVLLVDVDHPAWMSEFLLNREVILESLKSRHRQFAIEAIKLRLVRDLRQPPPPEEEYQTGSHNNDLAPGNSPPPELKVLLERLREAIEDGGSMEGSSS